MFTTYATATDGNRNAYDCKNKAAAMDVFHELAVQGITAHVYSPKGKIGRAHV